MPPRKPEAPNAAPSSIWGILLWVFPNLPRLVRDALANPIVSILVGALAISVVVLLAAWRLHEAGILRFSVDIGSSASPTLPTCDERYSKRALELANGSGLGSFSGKSCRLAKVVVQRFERGFLVWTDVSPLGGDKHWLLELGSPPVVAETPRRFSDAEWASEPDDYRRLIRNGGFHALVKTYADFKRRLGEPKNTDHELSALIWQFESGTIVAPMPFWDGSSLTYPYTQALVIKHDINWTLAAID